MKLHVVPVDSVRPVPNHLRHANMSYLGHLYFAGSVSVFFIVAGLFFLVHGILPVVPIPTRLNLDSSFKFVMKSWLAARRRMKESDR